MSTDSFIKTRKSLRKTAPDIKPIRQTGDLGARYRGQFNDQTCFLKFGTDTGELWTDTSTSVGNETFTQREWDGIVLRWEIPALTADRANELMEEVAPLAQKIYEDDGEVEDAKAEIESICILLAEDAEAGHLDGQHVIYTVETLFCSVSIEEMFENELKELIAAHRAGDQNKVDELTAEMCEAVQGAADCDAKTQLNDSCTGACSDGDDKVYQVVSDAIANADDEESNT